MKFLLHLFKWVPLPHHSVSFFSSVLFFVSFFPPSVSMLAWKPCFWHVFTVCSFWMHTMCLCESLCSCVGVCVCVIELDQFCWELIGGWEILTCGYICLRVPHTFAHSWASSYTEWWWKWWGERMVLRRNLLSPKVLQAERDCGG